MHSLLRVSAEVTKSVRLRLQTQCLKRLERFQNVSIRYIEAMTQLDNNLIETSDNENIKARSFKYSNERADLTLCTVIYADNAQTESLNLNTCRLADLITTTARTRSSLATIVVDLACDPTSPDIHFIWVHAIAAQSVFSISCAMNHVRRQYKEGRHCIVTAFNDLPTDSDTEAGTYLLTLKAAPLSRCVPIELSKEGRLALSRYCGNSPKTYDDSLIRRRN